MTGGAAFPGGPVVVSGPLSKLSSMAQDVEAEERELIDFCRSPGFSAEALPERSRRTASGSNEAERHH